MKQKEYPYQNLSLDDMKGEKWEDIPGLDGYFLVSNFGRLKRLRRESLNAKGILTVFKEKIIAPRVMRTPNTYMNDFTFQLSAHIQAEGKRFHFPIRRLVYYCFVKPFDLNDRSVLIVSKKGNGLDIRPENLLAIPYGDLTHRVIKQRRVIPEFRVPGIQHVGMMASIKYTSKEITQYSDTGKKIKTYPSSMEASRQTGISNSHLRNAAAGIERSAGGYFWAFGHATRFDVKAFLGKRRTNFKEKKGSKVTQYDKDGNRIARFLTMTDAACAVGAVSYTSISAVIRGINRSAHGYFWKPGWGKAKIGTKKLSKRKTKMQK